MVSYGHMTNGVRPSFDHIYPLVLSSFDKSHPSIIRSFYDLFWRGCVFCFSGFCWLFGFCPWVATEHFRSWLWVFKHSAPWFCENEMMIPVKIQGWKQKNHPIEKEHHFNSITQLPILWVSCSLGFCWLLTFWLRLLLACVSFLARRSRERFCGKVFVQSKPQTRWHWLILDGWTYDTVIYSPNMFWSLRMCLFKTKCSHQVYYGSKESADAGAVGSAYEIREWLSSLLNDLAAHVVIWILSLLQTAIHMKWRLPTSS